MMDESQRLEDEVGDDSAAYDVDETELDDLLDEDEDDGDDDDILDRTISDYCLCGELLKRNGDCPICDDGYMDDFEKDDILWDDDDPDA